MFAPQIRKLHDPSGAFNLWNYGAFKIWGRISGWLGFELTNCAHNID